MCSSKFIQLYIGVSNSILRENVVPINNVFIGFYDSKDGSNEEVKAARIIMIFICSMFMNIIMNHSIASALFQDKLQHL